MKTLTIEKSTIYIENASGQTVSFKGFADLQKYTGVELKKIVGKSIVTYEPDRSLHMWFDGVDTEAHSVPESTFDWLIDNVALFEQRMNDPLYGLIGKDKKDKQEEVKRQTAAQKFKDDSRSPITVLGNTWPGGWDQYLWIKGCIELSKAAGEQTVTVFDLDDIVRELSYDDATTLANAIGQSYRAAFLKFKI